MTKKVTQLKVVDKKKQQAKISKKSLLKAYTDMLSARLIDEKTITLYKQNKCHFQIGCAGHEAVQIAASQVFKPAKDWFYPYYRDMALMVGLGTTAKELLMNAMNKEGDPSSHGRQMPMHYGHKDLRVVSQSSPTGTQLLQAVGCAMGAKLKKLKEVVYVSLGEGTAAQGDFHEALNWASREKLPVIILVQNNGYAISVPVSEQHAGDVFDISAGYENLMRYSIDGTDFLDCYDVLEEAYKRAIKGDGPTVIEAHVPRLQSHSISDNHKKYRTEEDIANEQKRDPLPAFKRYLVRSKVATAKKLDELEAEIKSQIDEDAEWAEAQPDPDPSNPTEFTLKEEYPSYVPEPETPQAEDIFIVDALNHALHEEMERNPDMFIFGQDVAHGKGGVFTVTTDLTKKFGDKRCFNAPLAESSIAGVSIGLATRGLKAVSEIQFGDYIWTAMMQIRNELAMMNYRSAGDWTCPAVIRVPVGGYIHGACYHSQNIEATFAHFPGLIVLYPSNATDAKGLLKSAIRANDPVLFLEHKGLYRQVYAKGPEGDSDYLTPIGKAKIVREGTDATIVTWGALVQKSLLAAEAMAAEGVSVEVVDIRTISPLDTETIFESVNKTNRVLIAHEDVLFGGFGAEIAAQISDQCFQQLDAPIKRVGMKNVAAVPHSPILEKVILPQNEDVLNALRDLIAF
ncbi:MAG: tungsten formylmethanofuran dehydrogenase [Deltaproteobacteria bacterium]|nr:tungsten formylmethanofuran dehydrogenase [Deltaproteobacteria bacterium]